LSGLLLDSHIFHWYDKGDVRLRSDVVAWINSTNAVYVSAASIWELTIKRIAGKFEASGSLIDVAKAHGFQLLDIKAEHTEAIASLPRHHRDPFDHILLAQASLEGLTLVTHDEVLAHYGVPILLV
jgi:PIN domain nuclease of toxin-antitoxin system